MNARKPLAHKDGVATLVRPLYSPGLLLEDTDLTTGVDYTRNALALAMRSLFGCGVVCGLRLSAKYICERRQVQIVVGAGVALDCSGNLIHVPNDVTLVYDPKCEPMKQELWVEVCYTTCESKPGSTACEEEDSLTTVSRRSRDAYAIRVWESRPRCACACPSPGDSQRPTDPNDCCASVTVTTTVEASCCGQQQTASTTTSTAPAGQTPGAAAPASDTSRPVEVSPCACYEEHNAGKCGCECGGNCVLLGRLAPEGDLLDWKYDDALRRFVRPMLLGSQKCYCEQCKPRQEEEPPVPVFTETSQVYSVRSMEQLRRARSAQLAAEERLFAEKLQLSRAATDVAGLNAEITRLEKVIKDPNATPEDKVTAQEALERARPRVPELEAARDRIDRRIAAQQAELDLGEKRIARLGIDRDIAARQQELAYIDERILQRPGGKDAALTRQREGVLEALKAEMEKLNKLK